MHLKGIIFDFDGTLADSLGLGMEAYYQGLKTAGIQVEHDGEITKYFGVGADRIFRNLIPNHEHAARAFEAYKLHAKTQCHRIKLHAGVPELLAEMSKLGIPSAIVTGRHSEDLEIAMTHHPIHDQFVTILCDNHLEKPKPFPEGILLAAKRMNLKPEETIYVGDTAGDMKAAKAAGAVAVAALWDRFAKRENFDSLEAESKPDFFAELPRQVLEIFQKLSSSEAR